MKLLTSLLFLFSISFSFGMVSEKQTNFNGDPVIVFVSKNNLSTTISVHTYKYIKNNSTEVSSDTDEQAEYSTEVQLIIDAFLSVKGVSRCTFDKATQTFTLLTSPTTSLLNVEEVINKNK